MTRIVARTISATVLLILGVGLLSLCGCDNSALEEARQEARRAKATVSTLEFSIAKGQQEISALKNELSVVNEDRDDLTRQVDQLTQELDQARELAEQAKQVITHLSTRASGQNSATEALQKEVAALKALVADQAALIEELQKGAATEAAIEGASLDDPPPVVDPNRDL